MDVSWSVFVHDILDAAWVIELALMALAWVVACHGLWWEKGQRLRNAGQLALLLLALAAANIGRILLSPFAYSQLIWTALQGGISLAYLFLCSPYQRNAKLVIWCSLFAGICAISMIAGQASFLTGEFLAKGTPEAIARCLVYLLMPGLALYLHHFNFENYSFVPKGGIALILAGDVSILVLDVLECFWTLRSNQLTLLLAVSYSCILLMVVVAIYAMYTMCREQARILALQAENQRLQAEQEAVRITQANLEDLRCIRHDLKNQYAYLQILLEGKRYDELEVYFHQAAENLPPQLNYIDCGNQSMNTILNLEIGKARSAKIEVVHQLVIPPVLPFSDEDLCAILANLMDNAIEECSRLQQSGGEPGAIRLSIYPQKSYLFIMCCNPTRKTALEHSGRGLRTTKGDERLHGYGTRIISRTAEKYNGCAEFSLEGTCFVAKVMLDMMEVSANAN